MPQYIIFEALNYHEQALAVRQQLGDRGEEVKTRLNIGLTYIDMGDLTKAEEYMTQAVQLAEMIGHPLLEEWREGLERMQAAQQGTQEA